MIEYIKNATVTKARAMYGRRLTDADYKELVNKKSVAEAAEYLKKNTHYSAALGTLNTSSIHRGFLESVIRRYAFDRYIAICDFQQLRKEKFYNYLVVLSEIREILSIILHINAGSNDEYISSMPSYLLKEASFDLIQMAHAGDIKELLKFLKSTPYYSVLKNIPVQPDGKADYLKCEVVLRTYYHKWLLDVVKKDFRGKARDELVKQIETQIDFINIINAYRMIKFYGLSFDEIEKNIIPYGGRINVKRRRELFSAESPEEFITAFSKTYYGRRLELSREENFEQEILKQESILAKRSLMFSQNAAVSIYSMIYLFDVELRNVITIIEGIRYSRRPESILEMVVSI